MEISKKKYEDLEKNDEDLIRLFNEILAMREALEEEERKEKEKEEEDVQG